MSEKMQDKIDEVVHEFVMRAAGKVGILRPEDIGRIAREAAQKGCMIGWYEGVKAERKYMKLKESTGSK
jgi:hypothetical protein